MELTVGERRTVVAVQAAAARAVRRVMAVGARGVISVTERQAYILRVRDLAKGCCEAWSKTAGGSAALG